MRTFPSALRFSVRAGVQVLIGLVGGLLPFEAAARAQGNASGSGPAVPAAAKMPAAREMFQRQCARCHGADGTGSEARASQPEIPDFTATSWQTRRSEAQLRTSILDGKGRDMPSFHGKINEDQTRDLVAFVRSFGPAKDMPGSKRMRVFTSAQEVDEEFRRLRKELQELQRQFHTLAEDSSERKRSRSSESTPGSVTAKPSALVADQGPTDRELYQHHCVRCHGVDGTGSRARRRQPEIPDFADPAWQGRRSDALLLKRILDGKGEQMPPWRGKVSEDQARGLVAFIRGFAPAARTLEKK